MRKLVTDTPADNGEVMLNLANVKDKEVWIRCGGKDCTLVDFCRRMCGASSACAYESIPYEDEDAWRRRHYE